MSTDSIQSFALRKAGPGDVNAGFAFLLDCVVNLFVLSALLLGFGFPPEIIKLHIVPGALVGIIVGNILNIRMARRVARETGNPDLTAMPLGLDMPTTVGITLAVLGPLFLLLRGEGLDVEEAARAAWYVGMAGTIWMGLIKFGLSFVSPWIRRIMPLAALLGSMVGIAIVWLGANAILDVFSMPEVGLISLAVMVYALIAGHRLPGALPGAVVAILLGTLVYYGLGEANLLAGYAPPERLEFAFAVPGPSLGGFEALFGRAINYLAIIVPFALLIAASTINVCAGANVVGDELEPDSLMRADAIATVVGALFGNVVQTTPYFGHATYKRMGAGTVYSAAVVVVLAAGGVFGVIGFLIDVLPKAAITPVLIVVACDIVRITFGGIQPGYAPAVAFAAIPAILNFAFVKTGMLLGEIKTGLAGLMEDAGAHAATPELQALLSDGWMQGYILMGALARGYILTGLLWAAIVAFAIDGRFIRAAMTLFLAAVLALFGVIHSVLESSAIYFPWDLPYGTAGATLPYHLATAYTLAGLTLLALSFQDQPAGDSETAAETAEGD